MSLTVQAGLMQLAEILKSHEIEAAPREARLLLGAALSVEPSRLTLMARDPLAASVLDTARALAERRAAGEPMSHILGRRDFYGRAFYVDGRVLDPRPETEILVMQALQAPFEHVLDLGVGSGAILLTLLAERPASAGTGSDLSADALAVAQRNAEALGVARRASFVQSDWWEAVSGRYDLIVSNPPYIAADEMEGLQRELAHEPRMALTDEADGLTAYRQIADRALAHLTPGGRLMVEIGPTQAEAVSDLFDAAGLCRVAVIPDLDGRDRVVSACAP